MHCKQHHIRAMLKLLGFFLDKEADVNAKGGYYNNALQAASHQGRSDVVRLGFSWEEEQI